jgi:hypothetical protein
MFNDFLIEEWKWIVYEVKAHLIHELYFKYVVEAFATLNQKA